ncbi:MAG: DUF3488 and DUF4129 domain-containing transglutaminase family protein [Planctomycetota bacterium]
MTSASRQLDEFEDGVNLRLRLYFAILTALGTIVLSVGIGRPVLGVLGVFFSFIGFVFVDWLMVFVMPTMVAYALMIVASGYCVLRFIEADNDWLNQLTTVATMLVAIQSIMMLQSKRKRLFEHLSIFAMLELLIAAIFNDALLYGLMFLPMAVLCAWGLSLMATASICHALDPGRLLRRRLAAENSLQQGDQPSAVPMIEVHSESSYASVLNSGHRLPRVTMSMVAPAILLVSMILFYVLPRTTASRRGSGIATPMVGLSDTVSLGDIGRLTKNPAIAAELRIGSRAGELKYPLVSSLYLRASVLDRYKVESNGKATFSASSRNYEDLFRNESLPTLGMLPYLNESEREPITVSVDCRPSATDQLPAIAPYFSQRFSGNVFHQTARWTLRRRTLGTNNRSVSYSFGTMAFARGAQERWIGIENAEARVVEDPDDVERTTQQKRAAAEREIGYDQYRLDLTRMPDSDLSTIRRLAAELDPRDAASRRGIGSSTSPGKANQMTALDFASAVVDHFDDPQRYTYSLRLDGAAEDIDPIEKFVRLDRSGHCQHFAAAMTMMMRSRDVPARIVVGYLCSEFSGVRKAYIVRQAHAHAWVEIMVTRRDLENYRARVRAPGFKTVPDDPAIDRFWVRFDPTPPAATTPYANDFGGGVADAAEGVWDRYVVDMDGKKQTDLLRSNVATGALHKSYLGALGRFKEGILNFRASDFGGPGLRVKNRSAGLILFVIMCLGLPIAIFTAIRIYRRAKSRLNSSGDRQATMPTIDFYKRVVQSLQELGIHRAPSETPLELVAEASTKLQHPLVESLEQPLGKLTKAFYRQRFGGDLEIDKMEENTENRRQIEESLKELEERLTLIRQTHDSDD